MTLELKGNIDSNNALQIQEELLSALNGQKETQVVLDAAKLEYISSAGLRVLLSAQKSMTARGGGMKVIHVSSVVMEVFEVTGFSDILTIE